MLIFSVQCIFFQVTYTSGPEIDPDERDSSPSEACELVSRFIAKHLRGFSSTKPAIVEPCMYTVTVSIYTGSS